MGHPLPLAEQKPLPAPDRTQEAIASRYAAGDSIGELEVEYNMRRDVVQRAIRKTLGYLLDRHQISITDAPLEDCADCHVVDGCKTAHELRGHLDDYAAKLNKVAVERDSWCERALDSAKERRALSSELHDAEVKCEAATEQSARWKTGCETAMAALTTTPPTSPAVDRLETEIARLRQQVTELQTDNTRLVLERRADDLAYQTHEFNTKMRIPIFTVPFVPDANIVKLRLRLAAEEFLEECTACFPFNPAIRDAVMDEIRYCTPKEIDLVELVDGWADSNYIRAGSAHAFGVNMKPIQREVHRSNMLKEPANMREDGKILKPSDWQPPQIERLLREQGWRGP